MVQYSITPWRYPSDLLAIRSAFYPFGDPSSSHSIQQTAQLSRGSAEGPSQISQLNAAKSRAISLVSLYISRGNCPHLLASTSLLISASLLDGESLRGREPSAGSFETGRQGDALKCAYAAAFGRFVTGLLDGYQSKKHKMSMYAIAKQIHLPSTFVELRHQCTHEELPSISRLRKAVQDSLIWLWSGYWADLAPWCEDQSALNRARRGSELRIGGVRVGMMVSGELAERMNVVDEIEREDEEERYWELERELGDESSLNKVMERYLLWKGEEDGDQHIRVVYSRRLKSERMEDKLEALEQLRDSGDSTLMLASMKLFREIMNGEADTQIFAESGEDEDEEEEDVDITRDLIGKIDSDDIEPLEHDADEHESKRQRIMEEDEDKQDGWKMWEGTWVPKPIGIV